MGCLEHVFIHDTFGHPVYFDTYSGHWPCGEHNSTFDVERLSFNMFDVHLSKQLRMP